jgi:hypothetical protein
VARGLPAIWSSNLMTVSDVPVVIFLFNRASMLDRVVDVLCRARPKLVLAIADGPRQDHADDVARCAAARAVVDRLEGSCRVTRHFSETNLGCDARIRSGLDWAFEQVSEAIVLEDDVVPDLSFFPWCARMLDLYGDALDVMHVSGRNHLGRWTHPGEGHCLLRRGSTLGWATWRRAWQRDVALPGTPEQILHAADVSRAAPIVVENALMLQENVAVRQSSAWDTDWEIKRALVGGLSVTPSVNLIANIGFGPDATHTRRADDLRSLTPVGSAPAGAEADRCLDDHQLDRWLMLFDLMTTYQDPAMILRLLRSTRLAAASIGSGDRRLRHHLAPFREPLESLATLRHFIAAGAPAKPLRDLLDAFSRAAAVQSESSAA